MFSDLYLRIKCLHVKKVDPHLDFMVFSPLKITAHAIGCALYTHQNRRLCSKNRLKKNYGKTVTLKRVYQLNCFFFI